MQKKHLQKKLRQNALYVLFTGPAMLLFFTFVICSVGLGIFYSLRDWNGIDPASNFVGLRNYVRVFSDPDFRASLWFTVRYTAITVVLVNVFALLLAVGLNARIPGRGLLRAAFFTPMVISSVTSGYLWNFIVVHLFPMLGKLTGIEGLQKDWMSYPPLAFAAIIIVSVWQMTGYYMLIYLTGLQGVPQEIVEAATIDGCNPVQTYGHIVFPILKPTMISVAILQAMWVWNDYLLPTLVLDIKKYRTIPMLIQYFRGSYGRVEMGPMMACIMLTVLPIIVFYLACQKYIIEGVVAGAVKG